jgi:hypothetical protein
MLAGWSESWSTVSVLVHGERRVEQVLDTLIATGSARRDEGTGGYYLPR